MLEEISPRLRLGSVGESEPIPSDGGDDVDHFLWLVDDEESVGVFWGDRARLQHSIPEKVDHRGPEVTPHQDDRKINNLPGLDERRDLEEFIEGPETARHDHERIRVLDQHHLADEEVVEGDFQVQVRIRGLFMGEFDRGGDRAATGFLRAPVRGFHDARATAGHHRESSLRDECGCLACQLVVRILFGESSRAKDRHAGADKVKSAESSKELVPDPKEPAELESAGLGPLEKAKFRNLILLAGLEGAGRRWSWRCLGGLHRLMLELDAFP